MSNWTYWDYYHLFAFFERMQHGKIRHRKLFEEEPVYLKDKIQNIKNLSMECW